MKKDYIVYKTIENDTGLIYIGYDSYNRLNYFGSGTIIQRIIHGRLKEYVEQILNETFEEDKYTWKNNYKKEYLPLLFTKEILAHYNTMEEMVHDEPNWIKKFNATDRFIGYNIIDTETWGDTWTNNPNKEEIRKTISINTKLGILNTEGYLEQISKKVYQYNKNNGNLIKDYYSANEAMRETGINQGSINRCCNNYRKTAGDYFWSYYSLSEEELKERINDIINNQNKGISRKIGQFDKNDNLIKEYESQSVASKELNISRPNITRCCMGKLQSAGGWKWKYI